MCLTIILLYFIALSYWVNQMIFTPIIVEEGGKSVIFIVSSAFFNQCASEWKVSFRPNQRTYGHNSETFVIYSFSDVRMMESDKKISMDFQVDIVPDKKIVGETKSMNVEIGCMGILLLWSDVQCELFTWKFWNLC